MNANHLVSQYGYWAVFALVGVESFGVPIPGETVLIAAGTYAGHTHHLSIWVIFVAAASAAIIGNNIGYWIGVKGGYPLLRRYGHYIHISDADIKVGRYVFDNHGGSVVFFGRFVAILRTYAAFLAGTNRMPWLEFLPFNAAGGIVWAAIFSFASYSFGNTLRHASGTISWILGGAAVAAIVTAIVVIRRQSKRLEARAEAAYPGPLPD